MLWYRNRPHATFLEPDPPIAPQFMLRFANCGRLRCYIDYNASVVYCTNCYFTEDSNSLFSFELLLSHYVVDGITKPHMPCLKCFKEIPEYKLLRECDVCQREHLIFLGNERNQDVVNGNKTFIVIHSGQNFSLSWPNVHTDNART